MRMCDCCLAKFYSRDRFEAHLPCRPSRYIQNEVMPKNNILKFNNLQNTIRQADMLFCDIECVLEPCNTRGRVQSHVPCASGAYYTSSVPGAEDVYSQFSGVDCMEQLCEYIDQLSHEIHERNEVRY